MAYSWHNLPKLTRQKKRVGRGIGGRGAKSGRGMKGQGARAGYSRRAGFEGGQTPLFLRLPKGRGAKRIYSSRAVKPETVRVEKLMNFKNGEIVGLGRMAEAGLISNRCRRVKLVGGEAIDKKLTVRVQAISKKARAVIEKAGGKVELREREN